MLADPVIRSFDMEELIKQKRATFRSATPSKSSAAIRKSVACTSADCRGVYEAKIEIPFNGKKILVAFAIPEKYKDHEITIAVEQNKNFTSFLMH